MKRLIHRSKQAFAVEGATAKDQGRGLIEQRGNGRERPHNCSVSCVRRWCHALQAGTSCNTNIGGRTEKASRSAISYDPNAGPSQDAFGGAAPDAPLRHAPCEAAEVVLMVIKVTRLTTPTNVR
jgi:hypothetical protein